MKRSLLVVADPSQGLKPQSDTTLELVRESLRRGYQVHWCTDEELEAEGSAIFARCERVTECAPDALPQLSGRDRVKVSELSGVMIRKDPPFDSGYLKLCWLLALVESRVTILNPPTLLSRYHEKLIPFEAVAQGFLEESDLIPTFIGGGEGAKEFVARRAISKVITKPFLGFGGSTISLVEGKELQGTKDSLVQPFQAAVQIRGDRRVFFLKGDVVGDFARMPAPGGYVSNLAQGGTAVVMDWLPEEAKAAAKLGAFLKKTGIAFAGADMIGRFVSEVNITSPTGLRALEKLTGKKLAPQIIDLFGRT